MPLPIHEPPFSNTSPISKRFKSTLEDSSAADTTMTTPTTTEALTHLLGLTDHDLHGAHTFSSSSFPNDSMDTSSTPHYRNQPSTEQLAILYEQLSRSVPLQVKKLSPRARAPTRGSEFAAGYDMYASEDAVVPGRGKAMVATGIAIAVPPGTYGRVAPRSGLAAKHGIATGAGVIDYDYRGEVKIILFNHLDTDFRIFEGDRIAPLVLERIVTPDVVEVAELEGTVRGSGGFGSTGGFGGGVGVGVGEGAPMEGVSNGSEGGLNVLTGGGGMSGI